MLASHVSTSHSFFPLSRKNFSWAEFWKKKLFSIPELSHPKEIDFFNQASREVDFVHVTKASSPLENGLLPTRINDNDVSQREFMGAIIHELKTPLNAIMGFSEILREEVHKPNSVEECDDYAKEIIEAACDLNILILDLLDVGSQVSGNFSIDLSKFVDVRNIIQRSIKLNHGYTTQNNIMIYEEVSEEVSAIKLDEKRIKQILTNLISNSAKYSSSGTKIKIDVKNISENNKNFLQIIIADQGFGMTKEQIKTAFQKYTTIQNPNSGKVDSFGMGLPIVKQLVELQNGTINMSSEVGKGTEVKLKFPY